MRGALIGSMALLAACSFPSSGGDPTQACRTDDDCPASDDGCETLACVDGQCVATPKASGLDALDQINEDCKRHICDGAGGVTTRPAAEDVPDDGNLCTRDLCTDGEPSNPPFEEPFPACGAAGDLTCNAAGQCVGCNEASDCDGGDSACSTRTCVASVCGRDEPPDGFVVDVNPLGDCKHDVCDGGGNIVARADANDPPPDDDNACTFERCDGPDPQTGDRDAGFACDVNPNETETCDGAGVCEWTCENSATDQAETDEDCGGPECDACSEGEACLQARDCEDGLCNGGVCERLNGCTYDNAADGRGQGQVTIAFVVPGTIAGSYTPACVIVDEGTDVTWVGTFTGMGLRGGVVKAGVGTVDPTSPIDPTDTGSMATFTFLDPGAYGFFGVVPNGAPPMGAVYVDPD